MGSIRLSCLKHTAADISAVQVVPPMTLMGYVCCVVVFDQLNYIPNWSVIVSLFCNTFGEVMSYIRIKKTMY